MKENTNLMMPLAIIVAGALVAGAVFLTNKSDSKPTEKVDDKPTEEVGSLEEVNPVTDTDHILGNRDAEIFLIEYSDLECPFCARAHPTFETLVADYQGKVAWVYRHFPLSQIHPNAGQLALASECVAKQGGDNAFWPFIEDVLMNAVKGEENIVALANKVGVNGEDVKTCLGSGELEDDVTEDKDNAVAVGARGTPFTVIVSKDGEYASINGAQPIEAFKTAIDAMLAE